MRKLPILTAPTAAGKTALALRLGVRYELEVVSADAFLVYRGMDVGTAKPTRSERGLVPHHLIDIRDAWEDYDVTRFVRDAEAAISDVLARGRVPLVVGGTGFYLSALLKGLPTTPHADPAIQAEIERELNDRGLDALLAEIAAVRPSELERLERNPRRMIRTLEVFRRTGRWPSEFRNTSPRFEYDVVAFSPPLPELHERIEARVDAMFALSLVDEVRRVVATLEAHGRRPTALQAIGYKEVWAFLTGETTLNEAREAVVVATKSYAKRQLTWIRTQLKADLLGRAEEAEEHLSRLLNI
ncbi:tRNA (adenosine(37)-N6)-dimethylallyltransferase MiaA [Deinococcus yavapaiensis]|uniref:tRNA dimethylallyltransferase n=1 Tax=Deinococcus yavapaiensis KR-236 TaxID=694435 RepID=A0A318S8P1_9DEIO|nr:tRNA (adenosine(37)-N6)-dimethylallyltransferase MiaA [Deinococcus yavapaiensis]PYE54905.1 tRNA dimethylallyltransferase [Deinococcus yavapaiensis KR-236]